MSLQKAFEKAVHAEYEKNKIITLVGEVAFVTQGVISCEDIYRKDLDEDELKPSKYLTSHFYGVSNVLNLDQFYLDDRFPTKRFRVETDRANILRMKVPEFKAYVELSPTEEKIKLLREIGAEVANQSSDLLETLQSLGCRTSEEKLLNVLYKFSGKVKKVERLDWKRLMSYTGLPRASLGFALNKIRAREDVPAFIKQLITKVD